MPDGARTEQRVPFTTADGIECDVIHVRGSHAPAKGPVLLVHGAGVRANIFRPPSRRTLVDVLVDEGYDVWLENWRASIDVPHNTWTLDQAAVLDHPAAVRTVVAQTGADSIQAVIHCQGSTSFMMSAVAGLVPQVRTIVSNAVALHTHVPPMARLKLKYVVPIVARLLGYLDPQWGIRGAPWVLPKALTAWVKLSQRSCRNGVCQMTSFVYGAGDPTLWRHENLSPTTHEWITGEFAAVPLTFFRQIAACVDRGHLVSVEERPELPADFVAQAPQTDARFAFVTGDRNNCWTPDSQRETFAWFDRHAPGRHALHVIPGYGHLDVFLGERADEDCFPLIVGELERAG